MVGVRRVAMTLALLLCACLAHAQHVSDTAAQTVATTTIDKQATFAQTIAALTGGHTVNDVVLTGTATRTAGATVEALSVQFKAKGLSEAKIEYSGSASVATQMFALDGGLPACEWTDPKGGVHQVPSPNCVAAIWFFPVLSVIGTVDGVKSTVAYVGSEDFNGGSADHYEITQTFGTPTKVKRATLLGEQVKTEVYCDPANRLPIGIRYMTHPDNNPAIDIPVEIRFSDYQQSGGVLVPMKMARLINGSVTLDVALTSASINTGLADSEFSLQ